jgi:hypothetical protein
MSTGRACGPLTRLARHHGLVVRSPLRVPLALAATPRPATRRAIANAIVLGINLVLGEWAVLGTLCWTVCHVLSRINAAQWDVQWARTEPEWSRRT